MDIGIILVAVLVVVALAFVIVLLRGKSGDSEPSWEKSAAAKGRSSAATRRAKKVNWLVGNSENVSGQNFHLGERTVTIGRGIGNFIQISDENASRVHAQFNASPVGVKVKDMDSSNGTLLNGEKLDPNQPMRLKDGDEIAIGDTVFVYHKTGNFEDQALTGKKDVHAAQQKKTQALGAVGGPGGNFKEQMEAAVAEAGGDFEKAAEKVGIEVDLLKKIVGAED